jgi:hypothetical protein
LVSIVAFFGPLNNTITTHRAGIGVFFAFSSASTDTATKGSFRRLTISEVINVRFLDSIDFNFGPTGTIFATIAVTCKQKV